jgi:eukaryotic-like serine/threonine-protein kinase
MQTGSTIVLKPNIAVRRVGAATASGAERPFEPGTQVDRYLILERIGGGGTGQVYRARDTELDREVALKVLARRHPRPSDELDRIRAEAQAQARLRSPHVVTLYSMLELPFAAVLILEYVDGEALDKRLRTLGALPPRDATAVFEQALLGLAHVHEMGVIHRDLKPGNLFLAATGLVKIMDFSVARLTTHDAFPPRTMVGTLLYSAPEQISGRGSDARSDIYAMGMSLYEAVTGRLPFEHQSEYALLHAHVQEQPPRPRDLAPSLPPALERVIMKAIEKQPERRYGSALEFRNALLKAGASTNRHITVTLPANAYGPVPPPRAQRRSAQRVFAGFALDLILLAAVGAMLLALVLSPGQNNPKPVRATPTTASAKAPKAPAAAPKPVPAHAKPAPARRPPAATSSRAPDRYKSLRKAWGD